MLQLSRERAALIGEETRRILAECRYRATSGEVIELGALLDLAVAGTRSYPAEHVLPTERQGQHETAITVRNKSTLAAARRLADAGMRPAALNCASAKHPSGGQLSRALAQEETLARASGGRPKSSSASASPTGRQAVRAAQAGSSLLEAYWLHRVPRKCSGACVRGGRSGCRQGR